MTLPIISAVLQGVVALLFAGSLAVALRNLALFRHNHQAMLLKSVMDDYRALVADDAFEAYVDELAAWKQEMLNAEGLAPTMAYYTKLSRLSQIGFFYDHVGLLVQQGLLDFALCFEVLPMPYRFWHDTREFRALMKKATYAGFWDPFEYLHDRYERERARRHPPQELSQLIGARTARGVSSS